METKDITKMTGFVALKLIGPDGKVKETRTANTVQTAGKNAAADQLLAAPTLVKPTHCAVGTSSPAATLLGAEVARVVFDSKTRATNVVTMITTFPAGTGTAALTEAGIFNVVTANTIDMYLAATFAVINKLAADTLVITWTWTFP